MNFSRLKLNLTNLTFNCYFHTFTTLHGSYSLHCDISAVYFKVAYSYLRLLAKSEKKNFTWLTTNKTSTEDK